MIGRVEMEVNCALNTVRTSGQSIVEGIAEHCAISCGRQLLRRSVGELSTGFPTLGLSSKTANLKECARRQLRSRIADRSGLVLLHPL